MTRVAELRNLRKGQEINRSKKGNKKMRKDRIAKNYSYKFLLS